MSPAGDVGGSNLTIEACVVDGWGRLTRNDIDVYLNGRVMRFDYRPSSGSLRCPTGRLFKGTHTVEIEAYANAGGVSRSSRKRWTFNVTK